jgi:alpha-ketoglutaric semialdehyde dehydrogenase
VGPAGCGARCHGLKRRGLQVPSNQIRENTVDLTGESLIGAARAAGRPGAFRAVNPASGKTIDPPFGEAEAAEVERACALAWAAFDSYRETGLETRARFLEAIATGILASGDALIARAVAETGLPQARIEGERARTVGQLRLFAAVVRDGSWLDARWDPAQPARAPLPRADLRLRNIGLGPVAVFGASNFPLAFSVAGGDTASALAAGCPVVVKAHPAHPGTSELVGRAVQAAVAECGLPEGVFSLLFGAGNELGGALVADPRIKAVGFTGSRGGGLALLRIAANRPEPIPVYAEMSSINPVILLPGALAKRAAAIATGFVSSLTMGAGQFCTNPGLVLAPQGPDLEAFVRAAQQALGLAPAGTMLTPGIFQAYLRGVAKRAAHAGIEEIAQGQTGSGPNLSQAALFATDADGLLADAALEEEIFGASSLLVRCRDIGTMRALLERLEGQLTVTLQMEDADIDLARALLPTLERKAGRLLVNGWPTGVEVSHAMVHGGPFPATSDGRSTSVGTLAIRRFLRPVCYQDLPHDLLPEVLRDANPLGIPRLLDGKPDATTLPRA